MKRNPHKVQWTKSYRKLHGKDMTQDSTFEFERKRSRPERYDRTLAENTLKAIKTIDKVRTSRSECHIKDRMKANPRRAKEKDWKDLEQGISLVKAPSSLTLP